MSIYKICTVFRQDSIEIVKEVKRQKSGSSIEDGEIVALPSAQTKTPKGKGRRSRRISGKFQGRFPKWGNNVYDKTRKHFTAIADKR